MEATAPLAERYAEVQDKIAEACRKSSRPRCDVLLVAISKFHSADKIRELATLGQLDFGENYLQEYDQKRDVLGQEGDKLNWHFTGHLQSRKVAHLSGAFTLLHTLDSIKLAKLLELKMAQNFLLQNALIEINLAREPQKAGIFPDQLKELADFVITNCPHIKLQGLMCIPPALDAGKTSGEWFEKLAKLKTELEYFLDVKLPHLSMGMTADYEEAIAAGATIIRIGTAIFGNRPLRLA